MGRRAPAVSHRVNTFRLSFVEKSAYGEVVRITLLPPGVSDPLFASPIRMHGGHCRYGARLCVRVFVRRDGMGFCRPR